MTTQKYRLMIYFAHSTLMMYDKDIVSTATMSVANFVKLNSVECQRVHDEALSIMNYELSSEQMHKAAYCYLSSMYNPQSAKNTTAFKLTEAT